MKQTIHKFLLLAVMAIAGITNAEAYTCCIDGIYYNVDKSKKTAGVTYKSGNSSTPEYTGSVVIPESITYEGVEYPVTRIAAWAFKGCSYLESITIPSSVTSIGKGAFYDCYRLKSSINIPNGVKSIEDSTFYNCEGITDITIPNSVTSIGNRPFYGCRNLSAITVPSSVTSFGDYALAGIETTPMTISNAEKIGEGAFRGCSGLKSITISNSITEIPDYAFYYCDGLTSVTFNLSNALKSIGGSAFYCYGAYGNLQDVYINTSDIGAWCNISFVNEYANPMYHAEYIYINGNKVKDVVIPDGVTSIKDYAFYSCDGLTSVTLPESVTSIGKAAFKYCANLTSINLPSSVKAIGTEAFSICNSLTSITIPNGVTIIEPSTFKNCGLKSVTIPNSVTEIGDAAFQYCNLTSVSIPNSVATIGNYAFQYGEFTSLNIPGSATRVGNEAFADCENLTSVNIEEGVILIGKRTFQDCVNLKHVTIPNSLICIGNDIFDGDDNLTDIRSFAVIPPECTDYVQIKVANVGGFGTGMFVKSKKHNTWNTDFTDTEESETTSMSKLLSIDMSEPTSTEDYFMLADAQVTGKCTLYVPIESEEDYRLFDSWREFTNIVGFDTTGIDDITSVDAETKEQRIYSINGVRMNKLQSGLNIINGKKVMIK